MNRLLLPLLLLSACGRPEIGQLHSFPQKATSGRQIAVESPADRATEADTFRGVTEKLYMRAYSDTLQRELDERNARRKRNTGEMTLLDAGIGQDAAFIDFRDAKGKERRLNGWFDNIQLRLHETEDGEYLDDSEKGRRFRVTWFRMAYWSDCGGEVVEHPIVCAMEPI